jgi:cobalamin biosynthesis protein CobC
MNVPARAVVAVTDHGGSFSGARLLSIPAPWFGLPAGVDPHSYPLFDQPATALAAWRDANKGGGARAAMSK